MCPGGCVDYLPTNLSNVGQLSWRFSDSHFWMILLHTNTQAVGVSGTHMKKTNMRPSTPEQAWVKDLMVVLFDHSCNRLKSRYLTQQPTKIQQKHSKIRKKLIKYVGHNPQTFREDFQSWPWMVHCLWSWCGDHGRWCGGRGCCALWSWELTFPTVLRRYVMMMKDNMTIWTRIRKWWWWWWSSWYWQ